MPFPTEVQTERLLLRPWHAQDAPALLPILEANYAFASPWIPARVARPAPIPELARRLLGFHADFIADKEWRYALVDASSERNSQRDSQRNSQRDSKRDSNSGPKRGEERLLGEVGLFPRNGNGRVPFADADRVEVGYWLRKDATGHGFVTEAARALLELAAAEPRFCRAEIRCDERNAPSAAVPHRLGFTLETTLEVPSVSSVSSVIRLQVWTLELPGNHAS